MDPFDKFSKRPRCGFLKQESIKKIGFKVVKYKIIQRLSNVYCMFCCLG
jgi:hypothetical protein